MATRHRVAREARQRHRLGPDARCRLCGETALAALTRKPHGVICYECLQRARGARTVEWHHPIGRQNDPDLVVGVPANTHRELDAMKDTWPPEVLKNAENDPLVTIMQYVLRERDAAEVKLRRCQAVVDWMSLFRERLEQVLGEDWRTVLELPPLFGGDK